MLLVAPRSLTFFLSFLFPLSAFGVQTVSLRNFRKANGILVDTRDSASFNGWRDQAGGFGGHEPGALNLSASWLSGSDHWFDSWASHAGLTTDSRIGLYGSKESVAQVAKHLSQRKFGHVVEISDAGKIEKRLVKLPNYSKLVPVSWLSSVLKGTVVEAAPKGKLKLFEAGWGSHAAYRTGHIPQAEYFDTDLIEVGPLWNKREDSVLKKNLLSRGVTAKTTVIVYSRDTIAAARVAHILMYAGVEDVRLVDGGWMAWQAQGYAVQTEEPPASEAAKAFLGPFPGKPQLMIDRQQALAMLSKPQANSLVSVRSMREHKGEVSGYLDIAEKGDIRGAKWGHAGSDAQHMEDYRNPDDTMISPAAILAFWKAHDITPEKRTAFYCGTGWRASEAFFYAYVMGWRQISVYDGGWKEWSMDPKNPIQR